jgi:hypothetical protein
MTAYDPHLRRLMRSLVQAAKSQDASAAAWLRQEFGRGLDAVESGAEPALGNPANDGEVLSSTVAGVRSWLARDNLSCATPAALGTAAAGTADSVSRSDHVHAMPTAGDVGAAATWHGHLHRPAASVTLPANHSLWLARLEVASGIVVTIASGAVLKVG